MYILGLITTPTKEGKYIIDSIYVVLNYSFLKKADFSAIAFIKTCKCQVKLPLKTSTKYHPK